VKPLSNNLSETIKRVNLGCGLVTPSNWINVDYSIGARLTRLPFLKPFLKKYRVFGINWSDGVLIHNLLKPLPWPDNSIDVAYSSHTLEHMTPEEGVRLLQECYRTLKPNGIIRIVVPDLEVIVKDYVAGELSSLEFIDNLGMSSKQPGDTAIKKLLTPYFRFPHRCMYDLPSLMDAMRRVGFTAHERASMDSDIPGIADVELENRTDRAVIVEGRKS